MKQWKTFPGRQKNIPGAQRQLIQEVTIDPTTTEKLQATFALVSCLLHHEIETVQKWFG